MIELYQLEQLTAFAKHGTLSKAADELHMSQPTLTRSMQKLESEFGVSLFMRSKNRLEFNENGILAAEYAQKVLDQAQNMLDKVRSFDRASHTISIGSCAPMPLITAVQNAARLYPGMTISSECKDCVPLVEGLKTGLYQIIILPYKPDDESLVSIESGSETLFFALPSSHHFADRHGLYMKEMNGENMIFMNICCCTRISVFGAACRSKKCPSPISSCRMNASTLKSLSIPLSFPVLCPMSRCRTTENQQTGLSSRSLIRKPALPITLSA